MKAMYKYELAQAAGVSTTTFRKWCKENRNQLDKMGCKLHSHIIPPAAVQFLCKKYCIVLE